MYLYIYEDFSFKIFYEIPSKEDLQNCEDGAMVAIINMKTGQEYFQDGQWIDIEGVNKDGYSNDKAS